MRNKLLLDKKPRVHVVLEHADDETGKDAKVHGVFYNRKDAENKAGALIAKLSTTGYISVLKIKLSSGLLGVVSYV